MLESTGKFIGMKWRLTHPIFPNVKYGFNGRHFVAVTAEVRLLCFFFLNLNWVFVQFPEGNSSMVVQLHSIQEAQTNF